MASPWRGFDVLGGEVARAIVCCPCFKSYPEEGTTVWVTLARDAVY